MNRYIASLLLLLANTYIFAQPYQVGHISVTFTDSARSNRAVPVDIYYPADVAGDNVAFSGSITGKVPAISFGHGFVMTYDAYFNFRDAIVPQGYIVAFPTTEGSLSPSHSAFGQDLAFVLRSLSALGNNSASILYGKVDTMNCVMGHSMGGGASFLAASGDPAIKAMVTFAAAETTPSAISAAANVKASALVFAGINDCVSPPAANQQPMYDALGATCKQYIGIKGGSHCQMAESSLTCNFGESTCTPAPAISRTAQHALIDSFLLPWLDHTLRSSCAAGTHFDNMLTTDTNIVAASNCNLCSTSSVIEINTGSPIRIYPNPASEKLTIDNMPPNKTTLKIFTVTGRLIHTSAIHQQIEIPVGNYPTGIYIYELSGNATPTINGRFTISR